MKTINHECYVSLEVAKLLKEAGFDWECRKLYLYTVRGHETHNTFKGLMFGLNDYWRPTLDVAQRWLREVKNYYVSIEVVEVDFVSIRLFYSVSYIFHNGNNYNVSHIWEKDEHGDDDHKRLKIFNTYEEAQEAGIKKALEMILEKGE